MKFEEIILKDVCKGKLSMERVSGYEGIYCIQYEVIEGHIPDRIWRKVKLNYEEYRDYEKYKWLNCTISKSGITFECKAGSRDRLYNFVEEQLLNFN